MEGSSSTLANAYRHMGKEKEEEEEGQGSDDFVGSGMEEDY